MDPAQSAMRSPGGDRFGGNCFTAAYETVHRLWPTPAKVVHGIALYRRPGPDEGKPFWHAWVEVVHNGVPAVLDVANGKRVLVDRAAYYKAGGISQVFRYSINQVDRHVARTGHAGPWVDRWEDYEHPDFRGIGVGTPENGEQ